MGRGSQDIYFDLTVTLHLACTPRCQGGLPAPCAGKPAHPALRAVRRGAPPAIDLHAHHQKVEFIAQAPTRGTSSARFDTVASGVNSSSSTGCFARFTQMV